MTEQQLESAIQNRNELNDIMKKLKIWRDAKQFYRVLVYTDDIHRIEPWTLPFKMVQNYMIDLYEKRLQDLTDLFNKMPFTDGQTESEDGK
jgi:hypothetical protein